MFIPIPDTDFSNPDPVSRVKKIPDPGSRIEKIPNPRSTSKNLSIFNLKTCF
jgi:hypothetical protein